MMGRRGTRTGMVALALALGATPACRRTPDADTIVQHSGPPTAVDTMVTLIDSMMAASDPRPLHQAVTCELIRATDESGEPAAMRAFNAAYARHSASENARVGRAIAGSSEFLDAQHCDHYLGERASIASPHGP